MNDSFLFFFFFFQAEDGIRDGTVTGVQTCALPIYVTGDVRLRLHAGQAVVTGRRSPVSLYDFGLATYDTGDTFDQGLARGFVELWGLPSKTAALREQRAAG